MACTNKSIAGREKTFMDQSAEVSISQRKLSQNAKPIISMGVAHPKFHGENFQQDLDVAYTKFLLVIFNPVGIHVYYII